MATPAVDQRTLATSDPTDHLKTGDASSERPVSSIDSKSITEGVNNLTVQEPSGPPKRPIPFPEPSAKPAPRSTLTPDQQAKYDELLKTVTEWTELPQSSGKNAAKAPLTDQDRLWLTRDCLLRYLRATKWHLPAAAKRLQETLTWRHEYGTTTLTAEHISPEQQTGKQVIYGFDKEGRPCLYLLPNKQNTKPSERQVQHLVYMLERTIELMPAGQENLALLINFKDSSAGSNPSVATGRQVLNILQNHYPERLGRALISHLPWYVTTFFKLISPFIDPVTKTKMKFNEPLTDHVPASQLLKQSGGEVDFVYDHDIYWPALNELATQRRTEYWQRWEKAGKRIGESEVYLRGGNEASVGADAAQPEKAGESVQD